jgi:hypothetical protein
MRCADHFVSNFGAILSGLTYAREPAGLFAYSLLCLIENGAAIALS